MTLTKKTTARNGLFRQGAAKRANGRLTLFAFKLKTFKRVLCKIEVPV